MESLTGNWSLPFIGSLLFLLLGALMTLRTRPNRSIDKPATAREVEGDASESVGRSA
jgi:hypothetical protein